MHTYAHLYRGVRRPPSNNPQFRGSRSTRALISPGVFSSTGSRPWISTIRLVQRRRAVGNFGFWGNRWKHPRLSFEICYRTLREYKPGVRECDGATTPSALHTFAPDPLRRQPSNPTRPSSPAIHQRREYGVWGAITSAQPNGNGSFGCRWSPVFLTVYIYPRDTAHVCNLRANTRTY